MGKKYVPIKGTARNIYGQEVAMDITINMDYFDQIASANGYIRLEPGQVVVDEHPFTAEEADYLLEAIEPMKCNDCDDQCKARGNCLYFNTRTKLETLKEARDE